MVMKSNAMHLVFDGVSVLSVPNNIVSLYTSLPGQHNKLILQDICEHRQTVQRSGERLFASVNTTAICYSLVTEIASIGPNSKAKNEHFLSLHRDRVLTDTQMTTYHKICLSSVTTVTRSCI